MTNMSAFCDADVVKTYELSNPIRPNSLRDSGMVCRGRKRGVCPAFRPLVVFVSSERVGEGQKV